MANRKPPLKGRVISEESASSGSELTTSDALEATLEAAQSAADAAEEMVSQSIVAAEAIIARAAKDSAAPRSLEASAVMALDFGAPGKAASEWQKSAAQIWNESTTAFVDLASALTKARSVTEIIDLQSRFARARFENFAKLSSEYMEFAQRAAKDAGVAAFRFSKSA